MPEMPKHVRVRVTPGADERRIEALDEKTFAVSVRAPAERGQANKQVCNMVARFYQIAPGRVRVVKGHKSPKKILEIDSFQTDIS